MYQRVQISVQFLNENFRQTVAIYYNPLHQSNSLFKHPLCVSSLGTFCTLRLEGGRWDVELALNPGIVSGFWVLLGWWGRMISHTNGALDLEQPIWPIKHIGKQSSSTRCWPGFTTSIVRVSTSTNYFSISVKRADQTSCRLSHHSADKWNFCKTHPKSISILDGAIMKLKVCSMLFAKLWSTFLLLKKMWLHIITDNFQWKNRSKSLNPPNF